MEDIPEQLKAVRECVECLVHGLVSSMASDHPVIAQRFLDGLAYFDRRPLTFCVAWTTVMPQAPSLEIQNVADEVPDVEDELETLEQLVQKHHSFWKITRMHSVIPYLTVLNRQSLMAFITIITRVASLVVVPDLERMFHADIEMKNNLLNAVEWATDNIGDSCTRVLKSLLKTLKAVPAERRDRFIAAFIEATYLNTRTLDLIDRYSSVFSSGSAVAQLLAL
jgi:hypothetical protein